MLEKDQKEILHNTEAVESLYPIQVMQKEELEEKNKRKVAKW